MRRREFIELLLLAATGWPRAASAQTSPRIFADRVLMPYGRRPDIGFNTQRFRTGAQGFSWIDGRNVRIEYSLAGGDFGRLRSLGERGGQAPSRT